MRLTAFIMAILVLVLSCIPCADLDAMTVVKTESQTEQATPTHQHQEKDNMDLCSPFCHCACCAGFSVMYEPVIIPTRVVQPVNPVFTEYLPAELVEISLPIWQPPQLV